MKKSLILLVLIMCIVSCDDLEITNPNHPDYPVELSVDKSSINIGNTSGSFVLNVSSNAIWSVISSESWLTYNPDRGSNDGKITVSYTANTGTTIRNGTITISTPQGINHKCMIKQSATTFSISPLIQSVSNGAGSFSISVTSNVNWTVCSSDPWLTFSPDSGSNNGTVTVNYTANTETTDRTGTLTITGNSVTRTCTITQAEFVPELTITPTTKQVGFASGSFTIEVTSNVDWTVNSSDSWLTYSPDSGNNSETVTVNYTENIETTERNGTITITGNGVTKTCTVMQSEASPELTITPTTKQVGYTSGSFTIDVKSNVDWTVSSSRSWLMYNLDNGSNNGTVVVNYAENVETTERSGTITISGSGLKRICTIIQAEFVPELIINPTIKQVGFTSGSFSIEVTSNVDWTVNSSDSWLTYSPDSGNNSETVTVNYTENIETTERNGTITITGYGITQTCSIIQEESPFGTVIDFDGNVYITVKIGNQWWMAENLKVTKYRNGDPIQYLSDTYQWSINTGAFSYYNYNNNNSKYGVLYNWYAVSDPRGLAPDGWRIPSDDDWKILEKFLGMSDSQVNSSYWRGSVEGRILKSTSGWYENGNGSDDVGFNAIAAGYYHYDNTRFAGLGYETIFWTSSNYIGPTAWYRYLSYDQDNIYRYMDSSRSGYSVRCIKE